MTRKPSTAELGQQCKDALELVRTAKGEFYLGRMSYSELAYIARECLRVRQRYEFAKTGKTATQVNAASVAALIR